MAPISKEGRCGALDKTNWRIAYCPCGSADGRVLKRHVLGMLFERYTVENLVVDITVDERKAGAKKPDEGLLAGLRAESGAKAKAEEMGLHVHPTALLQNFRRRVANRVSLIGAFARAFVYIERSEVGPDSEFAFDDLDINSSKLGSVVAERNQHVIKLPCAMGDGYEGCNGGKPIELFGYARELLIACAPPLVVGLLASASSDSSGCAQTGADE